MSQPWEADDCADVRAYYTHYPIPTAAALWCGVTPDRVESILKQCTDVGRSVLSHPKVPCIEPRCRAMHDAINAGALECRRDGKEVPSGEHVAPERRTVSREALKAWISTAFPASRPDFLFDPIERSTHAAITADTYRALRAAHDAKEQALASAHERLRSLTADAAELRAQISCLNATVEKMTEPGQRAETSYLNIIGGLLGLLLGESPGGQRHSIFESQAAVIAALLGTYPDRAGISSRTLEEKFAEANRSLRAG